MKKIKKEIYPPKSPLKTKPSPSTSTQSQHPESPNDDDSLQSQSASVQTNASAKPPSKAKNLNDEESLALEAAQAERNAAKERHKQNKLAKKNGEAPAEPQQEAKLLPVSPPKPSAATAPLPSSNKDAPSDKNSKKSPPVNEKSNKTPHAEVSKQLEPATKQESSSKPIKSPNKLLPPSAEQRKAQLEQDLNTSIGAENNDKKEKKKEKSVEEDPLSPDVEREKAAVRLQSIARGRQARHHTSAKPSKGEKESEKALEKSKSEDFKVAGVADKEEKPVKITDRFTNDAADAAKDAEEERKAAVKMQKVARGRAARGQVARKRKESESEPEKTGSDEKKDNIGAEKGTEGVVEEKKSEGPNATKDMQPGGVGYTEALLG